MAEEAPNITPPLQPVFKSASEPPPPPPPVEKKDPPPPTPVGKEDQKPPETSAVDPPPAASEEKEEEPSTAAVESRSLAAMMEKEASSSPTAAAVAAAAAEEQEEVMVSEAEEKRVPRSLISFKEESNVVADLSDTERKALQELKQLVQKALNKKQFASQAEEEGEEEKPKPTSETPKPEEESDHSTEIKPPQEETKEEDLKLEENPLEKQSPDEQVSIWGVPLLKDDRTDVILLKFLRARDFKVRDALTMIKNTIQWRKDFKIDSLLDEDLGDDLEKVVFMHGFDRDGHPVCYNVYGEFQNKILYHTTFSDDEKRMKFLRWRIQFLERSIRNLDFKPGRVCTIFQVNDLNNSPGPGKRELRLATKQALQLLQDNYPEFVAKQVFINVPWWYLAFYSMISPFMTQRTKSKFVFAGPSKSAESLFKYISPEQVPIQYGGLSVDYCDCNPEFTIADPVTDIVVKPATKQTVEIIIYEKCVIVWEIRVVGWEVSYGAEFVPNAKDGYTIIIQKPTKIAAIDEPVVCNRFKVGELGKVLLTVDNPTSKKKKFLYRFKVEPYCD
ncbi:hypothetical protein Dsin_001746 [Dipteronia sinensis]|uniref:Patellin-3 n=1 Tax=Dipteronia sinensis TaxID=43782 RepID=A0AAE0B5X1_9ROSI|nr:hypothetical protein Dsin_001746 [Dipteronia sinensis]